MFHIRIPRALCALSLAAAFSLTPASALYSTPDAPPVFPDQEQTAPILEVILTDSVPSVRDASQAARYQRYAPRLLELGYSQHEADTLLQLLPSYRIPLLFRSEHSKVAAELVLQPHFRAAYLDRYLSYAKVNPALTGQQVVTQVNIGLDRAPYASITQVKDLGAHDVLVNKYNTLPASFQPELVAMGSTYANYSAYMEPTAYQWFTKMVDDARTEGLWLYCVSAYRSYDYQQTLYQRYANRDGHRLADTYSARPGFSEHQTGLAVDINTASSSAHFEYTAQYRWLQENCWKYGFILRYPEGKAHITGFRFEPWHYRYVGVELAQAIRESGLTYDEYVASQPCHDPHLVGTVTVGETVTTPQRAPLELDGVYYLSADTLAHVLDLDHTATQEGRVTLSNADHTLTLFRDEPICIYNGQEFPLTRVPFVQGGALLLPVEELAPMLDLTVSQVEDTLLFSPQ